MNLTLFRVESFNEADRTLYVVAPTVRDALAVTKHDIPSPRAIVALANNAYIGDDYPRFIAWEETQTRSEA